ncbi:MAG: DUF4376 domain-containing protein [Muribaculaceae bacterium]
MEFERQYGPTPPDGVRVTRIARRRWMVEYAVPPDGDAANGDAGDGHTADAENDSGHEGGVSEWWTAYTGTEPTADSLQRDIAAHINSLTDAAILGGMTWDGERVWLSTENQFNYKAAYDLAVQSLGASLPVTFKLGTDDRPVYRTFTLLADLQAFYTGCLAHVQRCYTAGWKAKDFIKQCIMHNA